MTAHVYKNIWPKYVHYIRYAYVVNGISYEGNDGMANDHRYQGDTDMYTVGRPGWDNLSEAKTTLPNVGSLVQIHYSPNNPADSFMYPAE
jgi:hypothetical protein